MGVLGSVLVLATLVPVIAGVVPIAAPASACSGQDAIDGFCSAGSLGGGEAVIRGDGGTDGNNRGDSRGNGNNRGNGNGNNTDGNNSVDNDGSLLPPESSIDRQLRCLAGWCLEAGVTLSDLARFRPMTPTLTMEPDGWMLIGLPANFIAHAETHVVSGTLFESRLDVRFTPSSYAWSWGDGSTSHSSVPGASWAALGLPEFSPTATSHVFDTEGVYAISVVVSYTVEFSIDSRPWRSIAGTLPGPATVVGALAGDAKTVLVEQGCTENPEGPGC